MFERLSIGGRTVLSLVAFIEVEGMQITAQHEGDVSVNETCLKTERPVLRGSVFSRPWKQRVNGCLSAKDMVEGWRWRDSGNSYLGLN